MFCRNCGSKNKDDAIFCTECGIRVYSKNIEEIAPKVEIKVKKGRTSIYEGNIHKCPSCGEVLKSFDTACPACKHEIRGRKATSSIQAFYERMSVENNDSIKVELIRSFPIPNNKEDIIEFILLASSNFDARFYATSRTSDSISGAWLSKIDQSYNKGKILLKDSDDFTVIESIYEEVHSKIKIEKKSKSRLVISGILLIVISVIFIISIGQSNSVVGFISIAMLVIGITILIRGLNKNKTNKQIEKEYIQKLQNKTPKNNFYYESNRQINNLQQNNEKPFAHSILNSNGKVVNKKKYIYLAVTMGFLGVHRIYARKRSSGVIYMFTVGLLGVGWFFDVVKGIKQRPDSRGNIVV